jgi:alanyl-tRNA synthetase
LRFDFTHHAKLSRDELERISQSVNEAILGDYPLTITRESYDEALESGVVALFGEKYGDEVRVVRIGDGDKLVSQELCGGTHVRETGEIGHFQVISEGSVGAGLRRIEAATGRVAQKLVSNRMGVLEKVADYLDCPPDEVDRKVLHLLDDVQAIRKQLDRLHEDSARRDFENLMTQTKTVQGVMMLTARVETSQIDSLRQMTDWFRDRHPSGVVVLGSVITERPQLVVAVTPDLVERGLHAGDLVKKLAPIIGGGGGGQASLAQAGGRDAGRLDEALTRATKVVEDALR